VCVGHLNFLVRYGSQEWYMAHCAETMTKLENLLVDQGGDKYPYEKFDGS